MKIIHVNLLGCLLVTTALFAQKTTLKEFDLPDNTVFYATSKILYNGETKAITPVDQSQYNFKNGYLIKESTSMVIGGLQSASQKIYTYNLNNELINISDSGGIITETSGVEKSGASIVDIKMTYFKYGNELIVSRDGKLYLKKQFSDDGTLIAESFYNTNSNMVFKKIDYIKDGTITTIFNSKKEEILKTTQYFSENNKLLLTIESNGYNAYTKRFTTYFYDANGNLIRTMDSNFSRAKLKPDSEYFKDGKLVSLPEEAMTLKPKETSFYNYSENTLWSAQISSVILNSNEIEVAIRAFKTSDGKQNTITNQQAFMSYLDASYQKIKTTKP